jgi:hypothetical protein
MMRGTGAIAYGGSVVATSGRRMLGDVAAGAGVIRGAETMGAGATASGDVTIVTRCAAGVSLAIGDEFELGDELEPGEGTRSGIPVDARGVSVVFETFAGVAIGDIAAGKLAAGAAVTFARGAGVLRCNSAESPAPNARPNTTTPMRIGISGNDRSPASRRMRRGGGFSSMQEDFRRARRAAYAG